MSEAEDEDDYMSDKFLAECCNASNDVRPGLIRSHAEKRNFESLKRKHEHDEVNRKKNPSIRLLELEKRKEGLEKRIEESNKGFALLRKMGYTPGGCIGKTDAGRTEPIPIELKADREGLGRARSKQEKYDQQIKVLRKNTISTSEYRSRMAEKVEKRQVENDLRKSQRACERLDSENNVHDPIEEWYWYTSDPENKGHEKKQRSNRKSEKRTDSDSGDDLFMETDSDDDIYSDVVNSDEEKEDDEDEDYELPPISLGVTEKLWDITTYLRNKYFYCIWCSVKYNDEDDLKKNCLGRTSDDH